jgi:hypothetical protein
VNQIAVMYTYKFRTTAGNAVEPLASGHGRSRNTRGPTRTSAFAQRPGRHVRVLWVTGSVDALEIAALMATGDLCLCFPRRPDMMRRCTGGMQAKDWLASQARLAAHNCVQRCALRV